MNNILKITITALLAAGIGLAAGYFIFDKNNPHEGYVEAGKMDTPPEGAVTYTCSMHPQIRQVVQPGETPDPCPLCGMDLIPVDDAGSGNSDPTVFEMTTDAVRLASVQTTVLGQSGKAEKSISLNGKIKADERLAVSQVAHVPGRIDKLYVTFTGEQVKQGQRLADIYSPDLVTAQRELLEALKFQEVSPKLVEAARKKLAYWKIPEKDIAEIEKSGKVQETFTVVADESGVVTERHISVGEYVKTGQVLFDMVNLSKLWVLFDAYEEDLAHIRLGDQIEFTTPSLLDKNFKTRVTYIDPVLNAQTRAASIRTEINNSGGLLKPEMFVKGILAAGVSNKSQLVVPKSSVLWTGNRSVVWVKLADAAIPSFQYREVVLGEATGNGYLVESGLEAGDEVVTNGAFAIDAAAQLNNQQSMMNKAVQVKQEGLPAPPNFSEETPSDFKKQLNEVTVAYLAIKGALVETDAPKASAAGERFLEKLESVDMMLIKGEAHEFWMQQMVGLQTHANKLTSETDVEKQRIQFGFLSQLMIGTLQAFSTGGQELFVQYCPMAFDNGGAFWISGEEGVLNPYFGDKMLKCGSVKEILH